MHVLTYSSRMKEMCLIVKPNASFLNRLRLFHNGAVKQFPLNVLNQGNHHDGDFKGSVQFQK